MSISKQRYSNDNDDNNPDIKRDKKAFIEIKRDEANKDSEDPSDTEGKDIMFVKGFKPEPGICFICLDQ